MTRASNLKEDNNFIYSRTLCNLIFPWSFIYIALVYLSLFSDHGLFKLYQLPFTYTVSSSVARVETIVWLNELNTIKIGAFGGDDYQLILLPLCLMTGLLWVVILKKSITITSENIFQQMQLSGLLVAVIILRVTTL